MKEGEMVRLRAYGGAEIVRKVIEIGTDHVVVCREEEYQRAEREGRDPIKVGFPLDTIIGVGQVSGE